MSWMITLHFIRLVDKIIQEEMATQGTGSVSTDRPPTIMETYFKTEGLSKSDISTMVMDMLFAGVDTVGWYDISDKSKLQG